MARPWPAFAALCALTGLALFAAITGPDAYTGVLALTLVAAASFLAWRYNASACALWLLVTGCTLEMSLGDLIGPDAYQPIIAVVKAVGLVLVLLAILRYGARLDPFNPSFAYCVMFITGLAHGLHPGLTTSESLRSLLGSAAPFAFSFSRLSRPWAERIICITALTPLINVTLGATLAVAGIRSLFVNSGGLRLAALSHPAFLAGFALAGIYACLIQWFRHGAWRWLGLLAVDVVILVLTGARAPTLYGLAVIVLSIALAPANALSTRRRWGLLLAGAAVLPIAMLLVGDLTELRLFNAVTTYAGNLSGRAELWPAFEKAAAESPWFGWELGAGNVIISPDSDIARIMHTWAAHNEYLRMEVEGGLFGRTLLILSFALWCVSNSATLPRAERIVIRLVFLAFACHAFTDNVLISTSASVLFTFVSAVFAQGRLEAATED